MLLKEGCSNELLESKFKEYVSTYDDVITNKAGKALSDQINSGLHSDIVSSEMNQFYHEYGLIKDYLNVYYNFKSKLESIYEDFNKKRIIDVGAGQIPQLAREIAKDSKEEVIAVDKFITQKNNLSNLVAVQGTFNSETTISNRDLLIGHEPCKATIDIIKKAVYYNIDFAIVLCDCTYMIACENRLQSLYNYVSEIRDITNNSNLGELNCDYVGVKPLIYTNKKRK